MTEDEELDLLELEDDDLGDDDEETDEDLDEI